MDVDWYKFVLDNVVNDAACNGIVHNAQRFLWKANSVKTGWH